MTSNKQSKHQEEEINQSPEALLVRGVKIPRIGGVTFTKEEMKKQIQDYIALTDKVATIVDRDLEEIKKKRRLNGHLVPDSNPTVQLLKKLKEEFKDNEVELKKIREITVTEEGHINIAGFEHKLGVCSTLANPKEGIYDNGGYTLFTHKAAMDFAKTQVGYRPYSTLEMEALMNAIPGETTGNQVKIILELLQIPLAGYRGLNGDLIPVGNESSLWSSRASESVASNCYLHDSLEVPKFSINSVEYGFSLILCKDKK